MVVLGREQTNSVTMDEMLHHCRAVARGARIPFLVGDMPFMSFQISQEEAIRNAGRFLKEGQVEAVKIEGGEEIAETIRAVVRVGIPVMGHIGLTPQTLSNLGGYKVQGKTAATAHKLLRDALALQEAGCFAIVLESVPAAVAQAISKRLEIPTIGAGNGCDGQVLVFHDALGMFDDLLPRFVRRYAQVGETIVEALATYRDEVRSGAFPAEEHTYPMDEAELQQFLASLDPLPDKALP
jgi:3-methyl-2-oxobutanoate hydroxymethyltransferase